MLKRIVLVLLALLVLAGLGLYAVGRGVFGSHEGPLSAEKKCCFTVFGSCELKRPTLARQMITALRVKEGKIPPAGQRDAHQKTG